MNIINVRSQPEYTQRAIAYLQKSWEDVDPMIYENCVANSIHAEHHLPQWYLLEENNEIIGCAGLIPNDFISRMDLYPWFCAMYVEEEHRGNNYGRKLIEQAKKDCKLFGFKYLHLCTDHVGYYEKFGFNYIGDGYHPWGDVSRIYQIEL